MKVGSLKDTTPRIDVEYISRFGLQSYGARNLYPQELQRVTAASGTAELCLNRYQKFIEGNGFVNLTFAATIINMAGETADDVLRLVAADLSRFGGFALHCNYNLLGEVSAVSHIPFEMCRMKEKDDRGIVSEIAVHPDWQGCTTRAGERVRVEEKEIACYNVFNPTPEVVLKQIENAGGISKYRGQILYISSAGKFVYPTPIYDACITDISTDEGLGNIKYRNARNNFLPSCMMIAKKGLPRVDDNGREIEQQMIEDEDLRAFQGDTNTGKILYVELENDEDKPEIVAFPSANYDKDFATTDASVTERIYAQFHQEIFHAIRIGKLGFSGQVMRDAYEYYAGEVTTEQRLIERAFDAIFKHWTSAAPLGVTDFSIAPLRYANAETNNI